MTAAPSPYPPTGGSPTYGPVPGTSWDGVPGVAPEPASKGRQGPVILLVSGIVVLVVGVAIAVASIVFIARTGASLSPIASTGTTVATLKSHAVYGLYEDSPGSTTCSVTDPSGAEVATAPVAGSVETNNHRMFATFTTTSAGDHTISCSSWAQGGAYVGVAISVSGIAGGVVGILAGIGAGVIGTGLTIGGIVWLTVRNRAIRRARPGQAGPGAGQPGGYVPQPGPWPAS